MATLKIQSAEIEPFWAIPEIFLFFVDEIFKKILTHMVSKCQNEISPIFYYGISTKSYQKDLKIPNLQPPDWKNPYWMSLYFAFFRIQKVTISKLGNSGKMCLFLLPDSQKCLFMSLAIWHGVTFHQNAYFTLPCIFIAININQKFPLRLCKSNTEKVTLCDPTNQ